MDYFSMFHGPGCMCGMENIRWLDLSPELDAEAVREENNAYRRVTAQADSKNMIKESETNGI